MRVLGVDFGRKTIGIATGNTDTRSATARKSVAASGTLSKDAAKLVEIATGDECELIVLGLPVHDDATAARIIMRVAGEIEKLGFPVTTVDESLSTIETHERLIELGYSAAQRKNVIDSESACEILSRYFLSQ